MWENGHRERWLDEYLTESAAEDREKVDMAELVQMQH